MTWRQQLVAHNPNVGIIATGAGVGLLAELTGGHVINGSLTLWGEDAAKGLGFLPLVNEIMSQTPINKRSMQRWESALNT